MMTLSNVLILAVSISLGSTYAAADAASDALLCANGLLSHCVGSTVETLPTTVPALFTLSGFSCQSGFNLVGQTCVAISSIVLPPLTPPTTTNPIPTLSNPLAGTNLNCGSSQTVCSSVNNGQFECASGSCSVLSCNQGYTAVGQACQATTSLNNVAACGAAGTVCQATGNEGTACVNGACVSSGCVSGYVYKLNSCQVLTTNDNPNACGTSLEQCPGTATGGGICNNGVCSSVGCSSLLVNNVCGTVFASQAVRVKRGKILKRATICPGDEMACPIVGSAAFLLAQSNGFADFKSSNVAALTLAGGFECLDTKYAIESCGGCSSMGQGMNCLQLPHSSSVGCTAGQCVIFSCNSGFRPNLEGTGCVKISSASHHRRNRAVKRAHIGHSNAISH